MFSLVAVDDKLFDRRLHCVAVQPEHGAATARELDQVEGSLEGTVARLI
jgi:hypothetical protein